MISLHCTFTGQAYALTFERKGPNQGWNGLCGLICPTQYLYADNVLEVKNKCSPVDFHRACGRHHLFQMGIAATTLFLRQEDSVATSRMFGIFLEIYDERRWNL